MTAPPAIVLAAGEGTRLRPLTKYRPKPMLPVGTSPILEHVLDELVDAGVPKITLVVGYRRERIQSHFGPTYRGVDIRYRIQHSQLGTGHALLEAEPPNEPYLLVNGDQIVDATLIGDVIERHDDADLTLGVLPGRDVSDYGGAVVRDGAVIDLVDQPRDDRDYYLNAGVYCCSPALEHAAAGIDPRAGERSLVDAICRLIENDARVEAAISDGYWADANYPWDLLSITADVLRRNERNNEREDATIADSAVIREPVAIGPNCEVGPGAVIGPYSALGENTTVGANAVVEGSVLDRDTRVKANATLLDALTGVGTHVGADSTIPGGPGDVRVADRVFAERDLGALLADRVRDAGGVTYVPGTVVGPDSRIAAGATVRGVIKEGTTVQS